jgi:hypothetical protein
VCGIEGRFNCLRYDPMLGSIKGADIVEELVYYKASYKKSPSWG